MRKPSIMEGVGLAILLKRSEIITDKSVCVETKWWRIPSVDTPEFTIVRQALRDNVDKDPFSRKFTNLYQVKNGSKVTNRNGVPLLIAAHDYPDSTSKETLIAAHCILVEAVKSGTFDLKQENLFNYLKDYLRELILWRDTPVLDEVPVLTS